MMSGVEKLKKFRRHHQEPVQRYVRMVETISSMSFLPTEDLDRTNDIHNLGDNLNTRLRLRGNRSEAVARGEWRNLTHKFSSFLSGHLVVWRRSILVGAERTRRHRANNSTSPERNAQNDLEGQRDEQHRETPP